MSCGCAQNGLGIVALRGVGDDSAPVVRSGMSPLTIAVWAVSLTTVAYIFYGAMQPARRRRS